MKNLVRYSVLAAVFLLALALPVAAGIVDVDEGDKNSITSVIDKPPQLTVYEEYGEMSLVKYESHDGFAIVNEKGGYFDKIVTGEYTQLTFNVVNTGKYTWSDYHFEFWDTNFKERVKPELKEWDNVIFEKSQYEGGIREFFAPDWQKPDQKNTFNLYFADNVKELGIRQVATTVPVPPALWLFGSGLLALAGWGYRRRKR